jgi:hypothetical protein
MEQRKKPSIVLGLIFCIVGIIVLRKAEPVETNWDIVAVVSGAVLVLLSMVINIRYLIYNFKRMGKKN